MASANAYTEFAAALRSFRKGGLALSGTIIFRIYTSDAFIPIEGATVVIRQQETPGKLLGLRVTNSSGETDPLVVDSPEEALSQAPETVIRPWTGIRVLVDHPEFERVVLDGIQVFPGITTVQSVQLIPLQEFDTQYDQQQELYFAPQPLWEGGAI
jgi:hypothetical protein